MIFPKLTSDLFTREGDQIRFSARKSIVPDLSIVTDVLIYPDNVNAPADFYSIFNNGNKDRWHLDWVYNVAGSYQVKLEIITDEPATFDSDIEVIVAVEADDLTFSNDSDIASVEPDILHYLPSGKSSFTYVHREARVRILAHLDEARIWKRDGERYNSSDLFDKEEFKHWSRFLALQIIFESKKVSNDDIFSNKMTVYRDLATRASNRATLRLNPDQIEGESVKKDRISTIMVRR